MRPTMIVGILCRIWVCRIVGVIARRHSPAVIWGSFSNNRHFADG